MEIHKRLAGKLWRWLPRSGRRLIIKATQKSFTVSVIAIVQNDAGEILLLDHVLRPDSGWGPPGGFIDEGEQPEEAIRRELREETSLELSAVELAWVRTLGGHVEIFFRARANGEVKVKSAEIHSANWFARPEMPEEMSPVQRFVIDKTLS
jgi:ADP-ribose pyrophosphatase YjhB (NUDIX family)